MKSVTKLALAVCAFSMLTAYAGPKISILGDSYSTYEGIIPVTNATWYFKPPNNRNDVTKQEECWWYQVIQNLKGELEKNESFSGSTVCNTGYNGADVSTWSFVARTGRLGKPDIIFVFGGANDFFAGSPMGEYKYENWTDDDLKTFRPALAKMFADIKRLYPSARVIFLLDEGLRPDINGAVHDICDHYSVPCVNLAGIAKAGMHPTVAGMKTIADQVTAVARPSQPLCSISAAVAGRHALPVSWSVQTR